jgi:hypothetical protein
VTRRDCSIVSVLLLAWVAIGVDCGGSSSAPPTSAPAVANGSDESYTDAVCSAAGLMFASYQRDFAASSDSLTGMDATDAYMKVSKLPYSRLVSDLEAIAPPVTLKAGHDDLLRRAKELLTALDAGDRTKVLALKGTPDTGAWKQVLDVPDELKARLGAVASTRPACQALEKAGGGAPFK